MKRTLSDNNLFPQDASMSAMSKSQYILAKHIPTHNPLSTLQPESTGLYNKPKEFPVDLSLITPMKPERSKMAGFTLSGSDKPSAGSDSEYINLTRALLEKTKENNELKQLLDRALADPRKEKDPNADIKCMLLMIEIERLHAILFEQGKELEEWKNRYVALEEEHMEQLGQLKNQFESFRSTGPSADADGLRKKMNDYRARADDLENLVRKLQNDTSNLKRRADDSALDAEKWKAKFDALQKKYQLDTGILQNDINYRKEEIKAQSIDPEKRREREIIDELVDSMRNRIDSLEREVENLEYQLDEAKKREFAYGTDADDWKNKYRLLESRAEIEGVPILSEGVSNVKKDPRLSRYSQSMPYDSVKPVNETLQNLKSGYNEEQDLNQNLSKEIQFLKKDNFEKDLEIDDWRNKYLQQQQKHAFEIDMLRKEFQLKLQQMLAENQNPEESPDANRSRSIEPKVRRSKPDGYFQSSPSQDEYLSTEPQYLKSKSSIYNQSYHDPFSTEADKRERSRSPNQQPSRGSRLLTDPQAKPNKSQGYERPFYDSGDSAFKVPAKTQESRWWTTEPKESANFRTSPYIQDPKLTDEGLPRRHQGDEREREISPGVGDFSRPARRNTSLRSNLPRQQADTRPAPEERITEEGEFLGSASERDGGGNGRGQPSRSQRDRSAAPRDQNRNLPKADVDDDEKTIPAPRAEKTKQKGQDTEPDDIYQTPISTTMNRIPSFTRAPSDRSAVIERAVRSNQPETVDDRRRDTGQSSPSPFERRRSDFRTFTSGLGKPKTSSDPFRDADLRAIMLMIEVERLGSQVNSLNQSNQDLQGRERALTFDNSTLSSNLEAQKKQLQDLNEKMNKLLEETDRLQKENERLSAAERDLKAELDKFRVNDKQIKEALTEKDREYKKDRSTLEDQIKNHQLKQEELENKLLGLMQELDQTKIILGQKEKEALDLANDKEILLEEVDDLEERLNELDSKSKADIAQLKIQLEDEKNKAVRGEATKLKEEHKQELQQLEDELSNQKAKIAPLERKNKNLNEELEKEKLKTKNLDEELDMLKSQLALAEEQRNANKNAVEKKLKEAANENEKRLEEIGNLNKQINGLKMKMEQDELAHNQKKRELENERAQLNLFLDRVKSKCEDLAMRLVMVMSELDRQILVTQQKDAQINGMEQQIAALQRQHEEDVENLKKNHDEILNVALARQKSEHENEKEKLQQSSKKFIELEKIALQKILENEFGEHVDKLQDSHNKELTKANFEMDALRKRIKELEERLAQAEANIVNLRAENQNLFSEVDRLEALNDDQETEIDDLQANVDDLTEKLNTLTQEKKESVHKGDELERMLSDAMREIEKLNKLIEEYQQKQLEAEALGQAYDELIEQFEILKKNAVISKEAEVKFEAERAALEAKILSLESQVAQLESTNENLMKEVRNLKELLQKNNIKFDETQKSLHNKLQDLEKIRHKYEECVEGLSVSPIKGNPARSRSPLVTRNGP